MDKHAAIETEVRGRPVGIVQLTVLHGVVDGTRRRERGRPLSAAAAETIDNGPSAKIARDPLDAIHAA
ncbi:hypothetical protein EVAR_89660_1 [Eumeta japonica]|uniref:Uncharacterized protein n=1 Tax=Eumeta variegata TaxID=151549 RepID=A0A4C1YC65_EUMVA|nr:hypothetical protein EVAR_89660_1 [Eumeta japonica]